MIQRMVRDFAEGEVSPRAAEVDRSGEFPLDTFRKMADLGLLGLPIAEEYGGAGADTVSFALAVEEIGRACASTGLSYAAHVSLGCGPIAYFGTEEQKQKYLIPLASGAKLGAFGLTEPEAGSDAGGTRTRAIKDGTQYIIDGGKSFITNAEYAGTAVITASLGRDDAGRNRVIAFIVPTDTQGFSVVRRYEKMGLRGSNTVELAFDEMRVSEEQRLGDEAAGFRQFLYTLDGGRIGIGALSVGLARAAYEAALSYATTRMQFGRTISQFQAVSFKLADMALHIELARNMVLKAAWLKDRGRSFTKEAAMAKLFASEMCVRACDAAVQIHGGAGYVNDFPVERFYRDAKLMEIGEGTSEVQRMVIARQIGC